jgi:hypothetical protein
LKKLEAILSHQIFEDFRGIIKINIEREKRSSENSTQITNLKRNADRLNIKMSSTTNSIANILIILSVTKTTLPLWNHKIE